MPGSAAPYKLWDIGRDGVINPGTNPYDGGFKDWLDEKVGNVYPITGSQPKIIELIEGEIIDLSLYETIE